jgi:tetrahydromethanopterin S-methyltransferase subunit F
MADTIGKCECINNSDKSEIDRVITNDIDDVDYKLTLMRRDRKELIESGVNIDELTRRYESEKSKLKNLLLRVRNTPECK